MVAKTTVSAAVESSIWQLNVYCDVQGQVSLSAIERGSLLA
jgi:hypothetical protein